MVGISFKNVLGRKSRAIRPFWGIKGLALRQLGQETARQRGTVHVLVWKVAAVTDRGLCRDENQDRFYVSPDHRVFVVADGVGGMAGGSRASQLAVEAVESYWKSHPPDLNDKQAIQQWLADAVSEANLTIFNTASRDPSVQNMATTIVVAVQSDQGALQIAHVGDSRAYLIREGKTVVLTQDHSVVMEMLLKGMLTPEQFRTSPFKNYLTRCVGHEGKVEIDKTPVELKPDDWILLCTDGLSSVVDEEEVCQIVERSDTPEKACQSLVERTLDGGAPDNVTIVAIHYR